MDALNATKLVECVVDQEQHVSNVLNIICKKMMVHVLNAVTVVNHVQELLIHAHHAKMVNTLQEVIVQLVIINALHVKKQVQNVHHVHQANTIITTTALIHVLH